MINDAKIGELNRRVNFMQPLTSRHSTTNEPLTTFLTSSDLWANMAFQKAGTGERKKAGRKTEITTVVFTMNYNADVKTTWRVKHGSQEFAIKSIQISQDELFMNIVAVNTRPWNNLYYISVSEGYWKDWLGNYWVAVDRGDTQPVFGNLTWTSEGGDTWTTE